jgi:protein-disulfide isomerase
MEIRRTGIGLAAAAALSFALAGCQRDDTPLRKELADIKSDLSDIKTLVKKGGGQGARGRARPPRPQRPHPDPKAVYSVPIEGAPYEGAKDAKVTIIKAFDFACPFCQRNNPTIEQLLEDYDGDIKVVYKDFIVHPQSATKPALLACAANLQGKWSATEKGIWEKAFASHDYSQENLDKIAKAAGLDMDKAQADMKGECAKRIRADQQQLSAVGVSGTPAFYINGRFLSGARPIDQFKTLIDEELKKANDRISKGQASVANYYDKFVFKAGKKKLDPVKAKHG